MKFIRHNVDTSKTFLALLLISTRVLTTHMVEQSSVEHEHTHGPSPARLLRLALCLSRWADDWSHFDEHRHFASPAERESNSSKRSRSAGEGLFVLRSAWLPSKVYSGPQNVASQPQTVGVDKLVRVFGDSVPRTRSGSKTLTRALLRSRSPARRLLQKSKLRHDAGDGDARSLGPHWALLPPKDVGAFALCLVVGYRRRLVVHVE